MATHEILIYPHECLRRTAEAVAKVDAGVHQLITDLTETMYQAGGIGLAAPQIGVSRRCLVVDVSPMQQNPQELIERGMDPKVVESMPVLPGLIHIINPEIISRAGKGKFEEGCLSLPYLLHEVERPAEITVNFTDLTGSGQTLQATGILATALQHEIDHLNGVLILDYMNPLKRERYKARLKKELKRAEESAKS